MIIRQANPSDFDSIASIQIDSWKHAYKDFFPAEFFESEIDRELRNHWREIQLQQEDLVLVAEEDTLLGFVAVWCRPDPYIDNLHVKPSMRSQGTGSALMKAMANALVRKGHHHAYLWVFEDNLKAVQFYERFGGIRKESLMKNLFGYDILNRKIEWNDLSTIGLLHDQT